MIITFDEWVEKYQPIEGYNSQTDCIDNLTIFNMAKEKGIEYVWSIISAENEEQYIVPGLCIVNREGYILCEVPWTAEDESTLQVNDNEMISDLDATKYCYDFAQSINIQLSVNDLSDFFHLNKDETFENEMTVGRAKYLAIEFIENLIDDELTNEQSDAIHNFYNQLI